MQLYLSINLRVSDIKKAFHNDFPFLKLEFFKKKHTGGEGSLLSDKTSDDTLLMDILGVMREGDIEITPTQSVSEVEQIFQKKFNLPVQVFRRMGNVWIETTETDKLSLEKQNQIGEEVSAMTHKRKNFYDEEQG
jgi:hypothetical protein